MKTCSVAGCDVTSEKDVTFFEFPTSRTLRRKWLDCIELSSKLTIASLVCSQHFTLNDYECVRGKTRLKRKVVPSIFQKNEKIKKILSDLPKDNPPIEGDTNKRSIKSTETDTTGKNRDFVNSEPLLIEFNDTSSRLKDDSEVKEVNNKINKIDSTDNSNINTGNESTEIVSNKIVDRDNEMEYENIESVNGKDRTLEKDKELSKEKPKTKETVENITKSTPQIPFPDLLDKEDIEDMITNYQIKNKKKIVRPVTPVDDNLNAQLPKGTAAKEGHGVLALEFDVPSVAEKEPVFIEVSVGQGENSTKEAENDCLMLLESVQVDVDPALLLLPERDVEDEADAFEVTTDSDAEDNTKQKKKEDPISLLTSSDEDEVIIQEPKIDTVDVSDETDEDDVPLVKLIKRKQKSDKMLPANPKFKAENKLAKLMWGMIEYYCIQCSFNTTNRGEYSRHLSTHSKVLQICQVCNYTTASKSQFVRHKRKHKDERRFKCHLCDYKARHNMSLIYHLKSHDDVDSQVPKKGYSCDKCGFQSDVKSAVMKHIRSCRVSGIRYSCDKCAYETKRRSDMKRHKSRRHNGFDEDAISLV